MKNLKRASVVLDGWEESVERVEGNGEKESDIGDEKDGSADTEDENREARNAAIHGVVGEMKHDKKAREEYSQHEERVEWSDKEFHVVIISRKNEEWRMGNREK